MKIGFFSDSYFPELDGVTYTLKLWRDRLEERGHEVYIIYPESEDYSPEEREIPVKSVPNPFYSGYNIPIPTSFEKFPELDIVHCHSPAFIGIAGRAYAHSRQIPAVYTHHTPLEEYFEQAVHSSVIANLLGRIYVPGESWFLKTFDRVTSNTSDIKRSVDAEKLPVGIDMKFFYPRENSFLDDLEELERPIVGYSGRISGEKNVCRLAEFAEDFEGSVVIVGEGPKKKNLREKAGSNVKLMDFLEREKLPEFYSGIDVFLTASTGDTLGLSTLEANACGTPVVAPDVYPFNKTIKSENGERYKLGDDREIRKKVLKALEQKYSTRESVKSYSVKKSIENLEGIYRELEKNDRQSRHI